MTKTIPMSAPDVGEAEAAAVNRVLKTPHLSMGSQLSAFERAFADQIGVDHAIAVNSGTSGLHLSVIAARVRPGDLVITTPFSFVASANCILYERAIPVFVDVDPATGNIDPHLVNEALLDLTSGRQCARKWLPPALRDSVVPGRLRAILPVHVFGQPADISPFLEQAWSHDIAIVEDACEAVGARYKGFSAGSLGDSAVFAFYPNKQMTTGEGGMIVTDNPRSATLFRSLRNQGRDSSGGWLAHERLGYNYRLDEMSAALGLVQTVRLDEILAKRARVARWYNQRLSSLDLVEPPRIQPTTTRMSWFVYTVRLEPPVDRALVMRELEQAGVPTRIYFPPIHLQPFYQQRFGYQRGDFPRAEYLGDVSLTLPFSGVMTESSVDYVCEKLTRAVARAARPSAAASFQLGPGPAPMTSGRASGAEGPAMLSRAADNNNESIGS